MEDINANKKKPTSSWGFLQWWKINPEELKREVDNYQTLKITQSSRGIGFLYLLFVAVVNPLFNYFAKLDYFWVDGLIFLILGLFVLRGSRWAMVLAMVVWTFEKGDLIYDGIMGNHSYGTITLTNGGNYVISFLWWALYMQVLYKAFRVECLRRKVNMDNLPTDNNLLIKDGQAPTQMSQAKFSLKSLKTPVTLILGIVLGIFIVALYWKKLPWQRPTLDEIYKQSQAGVSTDSSQTIQANPPDITKSTDTVSTADYNAAIKGSQDFLKGAFGLMESYRLGNNTLLDAYKNTTVTADNFGDYKQLNLSNEYYEAKGYFEKIIADSSLMSPNYASEIQIKNLLVQAANLRVQGIDLVTKGFLLKQQRGQIRNDNMIQTLMASTSNSAILAQQGTQTPIPPYNGEVEEGYGDIKSANVYYVDALQLLKTRVNEVPTDNTVTYPDFDAYIKYYSGTADSQ